MLCNEVRRRGHERVREREREREHAGRHVDEAHNGGANEDKPLEEGERSRSAAAIVYETEIRDKLCGHVCT